MNPLETYLRELRDVHSSGAGVPETSYYGCLERLLNEVGRALKPKVRCIINLANRGAGIPDGGLFTPDQLAGAKRSEDRLKREGPDPMRGQPPARGAIEAKSTSEDVARTAAGPQVERYCKKYGVVLVTNYRDFTLVARDPSGKVGPLESYRLADGEEEFWAGAAHVRGPAGHTSGGRKVHGPRDRTLFPQGFCDRKSRDPLAVSCLPIYPNGARAKDPCAEVEGYKGHPLRRDPRTNRCCRMVADN